VSGLLVQEDVGPERGVWLLARGKHTGKTLREVAQEAPGYLKWLYSEVDDLTKEQLQAIESIAEEEDVDL